MNFEAELAGFFAKGVQFINRIDGADFGCLRDAQRAGLGIVNILSLHHDVFDRGGIELAVWTLPNQHLRAVREKFWRSTLVSFHVCDLGADDRVIALAERRERK